MSIFKMSIFNIITFLLSLHIYAFPLPKKINGKRIKGEST